MDWLINDLGTELFDLGETPVTPLSLIVLSVTILVTLVIARFARTALRRVLKRRIHEGTAYAIARIAQYAIIVGGVLIGLDNVGVSITTFAALGAIVSVGIGFGLQNIAQNFISGLILLVERPIEVGDVLELANGELAKVIEIEMRATRIRTLDGVSVLVPNSKLISEDVRNLHAPLPNNRLRVAVGVAYGSDVQLVREVLMKVAQDDVRILSEPRPVVLFQEFGDSSLNFDLAVWLDNAELRPLIASDLRFAIDQTFREHNIEIPFPQRDLHIRSGLEHLRRPS